MLDPFVLPCHSKGRTRLYSRFSMPSMPITRFCPGCPAHIAFFEGGVGKIDPPPVARPRAH